MIGSLLFERCVREPKFFPEYFAYSTSSNGFAPDEIIQQTAPKCSRDNGTTE